MSEDRRHIDQLFRRFLSGEINRREEAELEAAAGKDPFLAEALQGLRDHPEEDHAARINRLRRNRRRTVVLPFRLRVAVAAVLVAGLTALLFLWRDEPAGNMEALTEAAPLPPVEAPAPPVADSVFADAALSAPAAEEETPASVPPPPDPARREEQAAESVSPPPPPPQIQTYQEQALAADMAREEETIRQEAAMARKADALKSERARMSTARAPAAASRTVEGIIRDESGDPLIGATVIAPASGQGTLTDMEGRFRLPLDPTADRLEISYTGYRQQSVPLDSSQNFMSLTLSADDEELSEVVITGLKATDIPAATVRPPLSYRELRQQIRELTPADLPRGRVRLRFFVSSDGSLSNFEVLRSPAEESSRYLIDQLKDSAPWQVGPGSTPVPVTFTIRL